MRAFVRFCIALLFGLACALPAHAETNEVRISKQPGLQYLPLLVMEQQHLVEKHAKAMGLDVKVSWVLLNSGGTAVDALLSGNLDFVGSGISNLLVAWSGSGGQVKGVAALANLPAWVVTKNPNVKTLKDFTAADKIAVPTIRVSMQATIMQMAADKLYGESDLHHFDPFTVALGHPDALIALKAGSGSIDSHFSSPPYQEIEAKIPGVHVVANSYEILGGPHSLTCIFSSVRFHDANPKAYAAVVAALKDANEVIKRDHRNAALIYLQQSHETWPLNDLVALLGDKNVTFTAQPIRSMRWADIMYRGKSLKMQAASWKDYFFPEIHNLPGS